MSDLVRLVDKLDPNRDAIYSYNPHAGLIVCKTHLAELQDFGVEPMGDELKQDDIDFWGYRCQLCKTPTAEGRTCANEDCGKPLHPNWHAVYCCNNCALNDL